MRAPLQSVHANRHGGHGGDVSTEWVDDWRSKAACAKQDPELWFYDEYHTDHAEIITKVAKAVCATCPVRPECLRYALDADERFGVYGGYTRKERMKLARKERTVIPRIAPEDVEHGTVRGYEWHLRQGQRACEPCLEATRRRSRERAERERAS